MTFVPEDEEETTVDEMEELTPRSATLPDRAKGTGQIDQAQGVDRANRDQTQGVDREARTEPGHSESALIRVLAEVASLRTAVTLLELAITAASKGSSPPISITGGPVSATGASAGGGNERLPGPAPLPTETRPSLAVEAARQTGKVTKALMIATGALSVVGQIIAIWQPRYAGPISEALRLLATLGGN